MIKISVILPVYNAKNYISEAIESVLNQSFKDFELLIYNDGSTDSTKEIIDGYNDSRIVAFHSEVNKGYVFWLNEGIKQAKGKYIARMDADDISFPERFHLQFNYMEIHPEIGVCGSQIEVLGSGKLIKKPFSDNDIRWWFFKGNPIAHPVVMIRKEVLDQFDFYYNNQLKPAEDYDMWWRMAHKTKIANLQIVLLKYRYHAEQESTANFETQSKNFNLGFQYFLESIGISDQSYQIFWFEELWGLNLKSNYNEILKINRFFEKLFESEKAKSFLGIESIEQQKGFLLSHYIKNIKQYKWNLVLLLFNKNLFQIVKSNHKLSIFILKSLIFWKTR